MPRIRKKHVPSEKTEAPARPGKVSFRESIRQPKPPTVADCQKKNVDGFFASAVPKSEGHQPTRSRHDGEAADSVTIKYNPHPKQVLFGEAIRKGAKVVMFLAGIRAGKTLGGIHECLKQVYKYQKMPNLGYVVTPTVNMGRVPRRMFQQFAGKALVRYKRASDDGPPHALLRPMPKDRKSTRLNSSHSQQSRMPSSA